MKTIEVTMDAWNPDKRITGIKALRAVLATASRAAGLPECKELFDQMVARRGVRIRITAEQLGQMYLAQSQESRTPFQSAEENTIFPFSFYDLKEIIPAPKEDFFDFSA